jgi:DNA-binding NarL/FixJ family response regulator
VNNRLRLVGFLNRLNDKTLFIGKESFKNKTELDMSKDGSRRAIIVSMPGTLREALRANLEAMPGVEVIALAGGCLSAVGLVQEKKPDIIVVDSNQSEDEVLAFLKDVKRVRPQIRLVVLTHTTRQQRRILGGGADAVLSRWSPAKEFTDAVLGSG